jgi:hypothetical protein
MTIAPAQYFGLGDIIFCQTLANDWMAEGHKVVWGVMPEWIEGLQRAYPKVAWADYRALPIDYEYRNEYDVAGMRAVPLRWSVELCNAAYADCMKTKYALFGRDWHDWRKGASWERNTEKEEELMQRMLYGAHKYNLIHQSFGSDKKYHRPITVNNGLPNVYVTELPGYSLFDWAKLYEHATTIHVVSSSNIYIMEMLPLQAQEIHLYKRDRWINGKLYTEPHNHYDYILQRHKYIFE